MDETVGGSEETVGIADDLGERSEARGGGRSPPEPPEKGILDEVEATIKRAAGGQKVVLIRIAIGREVTISRVRIAKELHRRFPDASLEISDSKGEADSVTVKDIEVE